MPDSKNDGDKSTSGFRHLIGMRVMELAAGHAVMEISLAPGHLNSQGGVHGGVLASLIDNTGGLAGCYSPEKQTFRKAVTLTLTTSFTRAVSSGTIRAVARKRSGGRTIFFSTVEVTDDAGNLVAFGEASYKYVGDHASGS
jgi:uncharacterized protein (TIGR00369 family)